MSQLHISSDLSVPIAFASLRKVVYGGSGAGKTSFGRVIFEELTAAKVPCGVIDLKADWWGLKSSADGKSEGLPVIIFGGDHQDVPIHEDGGAQLAEIVAELRQSFIIDLERFSKGKQLKFLAAFFDRLYDVNREALALLCDESDRYLAQKIFAQEGGAIACLSAGQDIAKRGRKHGIFPMFISQRNADLNKSVTELCEVAVVFRTSGPNDQSAVNDWFEAKGNLVTAEQRLTVMESIAGLEDGQAIVCSAHPHLKLFKKVRMRLPKTFDSSATPEIGKSLTQPKKLAKTDLAALNDRMKVAIEKSKENDPQELKKTINQLKKDLHSMEGRIQVQAPPLPAREVHIVTKEDQELLKMVLENCHIAETQACNLTRSINDLKGECGRISARLETIQKSPFKQPVSKPYPQGVIAHARQTGKTQALVQEVNGELGKAERSILQALANCEGRGTIKKIAILARYTASGGSFKNSIGKLRSMGIVNKGDPVEVTEEGRKYLPEARQVSGEELYEQWKEHDLLGNAEREILRVLWETPNRKLSPEDVASQCQSSTGEPYEATGGSFKNAIGKLRSLELVNRGTPIGLSEEFFL